MADRHVPTIVPPRHLYKVEEAAQLLSISRSATYELIRAGELNTVTIGRSRRVPATAISDYIGRLLSGAEVRYDQAS
ncbi:helix-turn-helix domain-containing protein [Actinokineospora auranticolor]|uniref:Excisionase family DNA binding protein n=1 Tax=Actinokineospora auranticolor TaxID=155976 RepID=A0A2S6GKU4_9PSEU|nr:helix-turn-helix domain-containing protein [Actinokineospora auranticolor]PPK65771.1 excisionase family DNA binding protein [Actinokineospora auranticolor]